LRWAFRRSEPVAMAVAAVLDPVAAIFAAAGKLSEEPPDADAADGFNRESEPRRDRPDGGRELSG
jgi:hypothetical protein